MKCANQSLEIKNHIEIQISSDLLEYYCAQDEGIQASWDYMLVIVVISVSFRESTLLRLETETVTSLALDLDKVDLVSSSPLTVVFKPEELDKSLPVLHLLNPPVGCFLLLSHSQRQREL